MRKLKPIKRVWCADCVEGKPPKINKADYFIPYRTEHYGLLDDKSGIDNRVVGICKECLKSRNKFQRDNTQTVDVDHPYIVLRNI